jgi:hypothetical protein
MDFNLVVELVARTIQHKRNWPLQKKKKKKKTLVFGRSILKNPGNGKWIRIWKANWCNCFSRVKNCMHGICDPQGGE